MNSPDMQRLEHILDYCREAEITVQRYGSTFSDFRDDKDYQKSIIFDILQIGELSGKLSREYRIATANHIQWSMVKAVRNIVVHDYGNVDIQEIWDIVEADLPALKKFCEEQLAGAETEDAP